MQNKTLGFVVVGLMIVGAFGAVPAAAASQSAASLDPPTCVGVGTGNVCAGIYSDGTSGCVGVWNDGHCTGIQL